MKGQSLHPRCQLVMRDMRVAATKVVLITMMSLTVMKTNTTSAIPNPCVSFHDLDNLDKPVIRELAPLTRVLSTGEATFSI